MGNKLTATEILKGTAYAFDEAYIEGGEDSNYAETEAINWLTDNTSMSASKAKDYVFSHYEELMSLGGGSVSASEYIPADEIE